MGLLHNVWWLCQELPSSSMGSENWIRLWTFRSLEYLINQTHAWHVSWKNEEEKNGQKANSARIHSCSSVTAGEPNAENAFDQFTFIYIMYINFAKINYNGLAYCMGCWDVGMLVCHVCIEYI